VKTPVSLADIAPTAAGLLDLPPIPNVDGRDLTAALLAREEPPATDVYAETEYPTLFGWSALASLRRGDHKLISAPLPELYELSRDPRESRNVYADERRVMRALSDSLAKLRATMAKPVQRSTPDAETLAKLASLGYVGGMPAPRAGAAPDPKAMAPLFRKFEEATWAMTAGRNDEAAAALEGLVKSDPENPIFRTSLAKVERLRKRPERAIELFREAVAFAPDDPQAWYNLAAAFQEAGDLRHAGEAVREALRRDARNADAHNVLGIVHSAEGQPAKALEEFQKAASLDPRNARVHNNIGNASRALGRADEADAAFRRAIALAPNYADPFNGLGALNIDRNRFPEAVTNFARALELAPDHLEARLNHAVALQLSGDLAAAAVEYRDFIARSRSDPAFAEQRRAAQAMLDRLR
jgi:Tfp pilus assembly protein PilF